MIGVDSNPCFGNPRCATLEVEAAPLGLEEAEPEPAPEIEAPKRVIRGGDVPEPVPEIVVDARGVVGDAHAGDWHRQVSLLADEAIDCSGVLRPVHQAIYDPILAECQRLGIFFKERQSDLDADERSYWGD